MCPKLQGDLRTEPEGRDGKHYHHNHLRKTRLEKPRVICVFIDLLCFFSRIPIDSVSTDSVVVSLPTTEQGKASQVRHVIHGGVLIRSPGTDWEKQSLGMWTGHSPGSRPHLCVSSSAVSQFRCPRFMAHSCMPSHPFLAPKCFGKSALLNVSSMPGFALCTLCTNLFITCFYFCMYWVSVPCICSSLEEELRVCPHCPLSPTPPGSPQRPSQPLSARESLGIEAVSASPASSPAPRPNGLRSRGNASSPLPQAPSSPASTSSRAGASGWLCGPSCCSPCSVTGWCC